GPDAVHCIQRAMGHPGGGGQADALDRQANAIHGERDSMTFSDTAQLSTLTYERHFLSHDVRHIAGVDEVGRGALAGPLMAAAVVLPSLEEIGRDATFWNAVRDSKPITMKRRGELAKGIIQLACDWSIAHVSPVALDCRRAW